MIVMENNKGFFLSNKLIVNDDDEIFCMYSFNDSIIRTCDAED